MNLTRVFIFISMVFFLSLEACPDQELAKITAKPADEVIPDVDGSQITDPVNDDKKDDDKKDDDKKDDDKKDDDKKDDDKKDDDDDVAVCDPYDDGKSGELNIIGTLKSSKNVAKGKNNFLFNTVAEGTLIKKKNVDGTLGKPFKIYMANLNLTPRAHTSGFESFNGEILKGEDEKKLTAYYVLELEGEIQLSDRDREGFYEFGGISDDGSELLLQDEKGEFVTYYSRQETHAPHFYCYKNNDKKDYIKEQNKKYYSDPYIYLKKGQKLKFKIKYNQGPPMHIALMLLWRFHGIEKPKEYVKYQNCHKYMMGAYKTVLDAGGSDCSADCVVINDNAKEKAACEAVKNNICKEPWKVLAPSNFAKKEGTTNPCN